MLPDWTIIPEEDLSEELKASLSVWSRVVSWEYRIMRHNGGGTVEKPPAEYLAIHEVYVDSDGVAIYWNDEPEQITADDIVTLREVYEMISEAFNRPVIDYPVVDYEEND